MADSRTSRLLKSLGPGLLVAATGVGAGDLATGAFTGSKLGVAILWAVVLGAFLKYLVNEGLARYQLVTDATLLEGAVQTFGRPLNYAFAVYLLLWSLFVGSALMSACGATAHAILPVFKPADGKIVFGLLHSGVAVVLVLRGGYALFEKVMSVCIAVMFATVVLTAVTLGGDPAAILQGLFVPTIPQVDGVGLQWTIALMGGVGGTLTILCYGYWIREENRRGSQAICGSRVDLACGYIMTAFFGMAMVVIGSRVPLSGSTGAALIVDIGETLQTELGRLGPVARWMFLIGAWGAVFSSLLGVLQSVPYLFADFWQLAQQDRKDFRPQPVDTSAWPYRGYLLGLAIVPAVGLWVKFEQVQKVYAIFGALFVPLVAVVLLVLNGPFGKLPVEYRNRWLTNLLLVATVLLFAWFGFYEVRGKFLS